MSVRIRLARIGKKKAPFYRIVAIDKRVKRDGKFLENLGTFNPLSGELIQFHADRVQAWIDQGAVPSDSVVKLQRLFKKSQIVSEDSVALAKQKTSSKKVASVVEKIEEKSTELQEENKA